MTQPTGDAEPRTNRPRVPPVPGKRSVLCPYCGEISSDMSRCGACGGHFDPLSRQASQNAMGAWFIRDPARPFRPGCSYETLRELVRRGKIGPETIIRGPTTHQFWTFAARAPSIANLLGRCHNCHSAVDPNAYMCASCGAAFTPETDRQHLGLAPVHLLPGQTPPEMIAASAAPHDVPVASAPKTSARPTADVARIKGSAGPDELARLRRQLRLQWAAVAAIFLIMAGLGVWIARAAFQDSATPAIPATAEGGRPLQEQGGDAAARPAEEAGPIGDAQPDPEAAASLDVEPESRSEAEEQRSIDAARAAAAFFGELTAVPLNLGAAVQLAREAAAAGLGHRPMEAVRSRQEQLGLGWLP